MYHQFEKFYVTCIFQSTTDTKVNNIRQHSLCIVQGAEGHREYFLKGQNFFRSPHIIQNFLTTPPPSLAEESKIIIGNTDEMVERLMFKIKKLKTKGNQRFTDFCEIKISKEEDIKVQALYF